MKETAKFCSYCHAPNSLSARFCTSCGNALSSVGVTTPIATVALPYTNYASPVPQVNPILTASSYPILPKPSQLQTLSILCLIDGVISILIGLFWLSLVCTAPLGVYSIIVGIFDIAYALRILPDPITVDRGTDTIPLIQTSKPNKGLAAMQILNIISLNIFSLVTGLLSLSWSSNQTVQEYFAQVSKQLPHTAQIETPDQSLIRRIADYERLSGILWIILGALQTLSVIGAIAGIWNIFAGISHCKMAPRILRRDAAVPAAYESITQLIIIGILNLTLGGMIGLIFVGLDFYIRDQVLTNRRLFNQTW